MFSVKRVLEPHQPKQGGQALVEFALILIILLMIIFVVIESARIFQANLTVQNAARDAGRYAITGEFDASCLADSPPCDDPRLVSVKARALAALEGLRLDPNATFNDPYYFLIEVYSLDDQGNWVPDTVGDPGDPVLVRVTYRVGIVTPLVNSIARTVQVRGQVVYNNEESGQTSLSSGANPGSDDAPDLPPLPDTAPTPTPTPIPPVLTISKTASESEVEIGDPFSYTIVVENTGGGLATNVMLTDTLPSEVTLGPVPVGCTAVSGGFRCALGDLAPGDNPSIGFQVTASSVGPAENTAQVSSAEFGPVSDTETTIITDPDSVDLDIRKTAPSLQMTAGQTFDYTIDVRNLGPADATNIVVTDVLDAGLTYVNATTTLGDCNINGSTVTCDYTGPLAANGAHMIITLTVEATGVGQISNTATVTAAETDPDESNNSSTAVISVDPVADLSIAKTVEPETVGVRDFITYTLSITNLGSEPATNVTVIDDLPNGVGLVSMSTPVGSCEQQPDTSAEIICALGTLAVNQTVEIEIVAIPTVADNHVTNTADVFANELDPDPGNNTASVSVFIEPRADLSITKTASESRVHVDDNFIYTLEVTNSDDSFTDAPNVVVTDQLASDRVNVLSAEPSQGECTISQDDLVVCTLGDMAIGASATIDITVDPLPQGVEGDGGGDLFNSAGVEYGNGAGTIYEDMDPSNNSDEITIFVGPGAEAISVEPICGDPGETVVVSGTGWTTSGPQDVTITFDLGGSFETVYAVGPVEPDASGTWTINPSITIPDGLIAPDHWGFYTILAQGRADEEAEAQFEFPCPAPDLTPISLTLVAPPPVATESVEFDVVIENVGRVNAGPFTVTLYFDPDPLPAEGDTQIASGQVATRQVNGLAVGASTTVRLQVPNGFPDHGTHTAWVLVDSNQAIDEELDTNNITGDEYLVLARPVAADDAYSLDEDTILDVVAPGVLENDSDADASTAGLTANLETAPAHGDLSLNADGSFTYTPDLHYNGPDSFTYRACDSTNLCSSAATVSLTVNPINDAPVADDDTVTTDEDSALNIGVLANDSDVDGDTLTVSNVTQPLNGTVTNNGDSVTYNPDPDFNGTDTFEYTVDDGNGGTDTATVTVTVAPVNDAPVAVNDSYEVNEDDVLTVSAVNGVLNNDEDVDNPLSISSHTLTSNGTLTFNEADGSFEYAPNGDFCGQDTFTYTLDDGAATDTGTVTIVVICVNDAPVAVDDAYSTQEDISLTVSALEGVLSNDTTVDGDTLTASTLAEPTNGTLSLNPDGSFIYTPDDNFNSTDTFTYEVCDPDQLCDTGTVAINVSSVNDAPVASDDTATTDEDLTVNIDVLGNDSDADGDTLTVSAVTQPQNGTVTNNGDSVTYAPDPHYNGTDTFVYTVADGNGGTDTATVAVTVNSVNDAPVAVNDSYEVNEDGVLTVSAVNGVLRNDSDVDDPLTISGNTQPSGGTVTLNADGSFDYVPDADFCGSDSFTYTLDDGAATDTATVLITVNCIADTPVARNDSYSVQEDGTLTVDVVEGVLADDTDGDGDSLTATKLSDPTNGTLAFNPDGSFDYTPDGNFNGTDSFTYEACDSGGLCDNATVTITVASVNDEPVANDDVATTDEDFAVIVDVLANDTDADGDALAVISTTVPANGTLTSNTDGTFDYTPDDNYCGPDEFTYSVEDGNGGSDTATVSITVTCLNDAPVAGNDSYSVDEDTSLNVAASGVLANDGDVEGESLSITGNTDPANGSVALNPDGSFEYTPDDDFCGQDTFTYSISDGTDTDTATVSITVNCVSDAPDALADTVDVDEDTSTPIDVVANDVDPDGNLDPASTTVIAGPANGTLVNNGDGTFNYTPNDNYDGSDSFTYGICDSGDDLDPATDADDLCDEALVSITVLPVNDPPVANGDSFTIDEDTTLDESAATLLANDTDLEGDTLAVSDYGQPANGTVTDNSDGTFTYAPNADYCGDDTFDYTISDGNGGSDTGTVTITVTCINDPPDAMDDVATVYTGTARIIEVLDNDIQVDVGDSLTVTAVTDGAQGPVVINADNTVTYTPVDGYQGPDSFTYTIEDGSGATDTATVNLSIIPPP